MSKTGKSRLSRLLPKFLRGGDKKTDGGIDSKSPYCVIHFLDDSDHQMQFKGSWKGGALQEKVCELLNLHEKDYFGLRFIDSSGQTHWLDGNKSLSSQFKGCQTPYKLYFGVKFYAADPCKLREEITRYLFFLQVKQDILQGRLPVTFDEASELCAYSVQSELGDYDPRQHTNGYVSEFCFVPNQTEELERRVAALHRRMGGMVPLMAEFRYLDKVKWLDMYGVDLHPVLGEGNVEYFLGLTPTGIVVYKNKNKVGNYFWPRINKVTFKGKIFIVKVKDKNNEEHVYAFELSRKTACKHLWKCCVEHHAFFRLNQTQERSSRENRVLRSVSNHRSGRSERQALSDNLARNPTNVNRLPSRRQPRRVSSDSRINDRDYDSQYDQDTGMVTMMMKPEPVRTPRHRSLPELQGHESPRSTKSAPWETNYDYGLYTHGKESPVSEQNNKAREQRSRAVAGSDSESGISQRRKYFPNRRGSDNDSDVSVTRRRRREIDSDSASDVSSRHPANQGQNGRSKSAFPVLYPFHDKENRPNGSVPSLHSAPAGEAKQRRRRRRSKSPSKRPPEELKQHFEYELKSTDGLSADELKEIPFINVETKASVFKLKYSPKLRQKVKAAKQKSLGELDQNRNQMMKKQNSGFLDEDKEPAMSVRSQPLPSKGYGDRDSEGHSQSRGGAYDSDINPSAPRTRDRPADRGETQRGDTNRYSHRHSRGETEDYEYSDAGRGKADSERLHPKSVAGDTWREGSSSGQRGDGQMGSQRQYREDSSSQQQQSDSYLSPPKSSQGIPSQISSPPTYGGRRQGNVSFSSLSSPPPTYLHYQRHQQLRAQSSAPASSYATHSSYNYTSSYPSSSHYDQGQRPRSYVPDERSRSAQNPYDDYRLRDKPDRSGTYGTEDGQQGRYQGEGPDRSRTSLRDVRPRSTYQVEPGPQQQQQQQYDYQQHSGYQHGPSNQNSPHQYRHPSPQPQNQGMQSRTQGTPPRSQGTPPRHQAPSHYQGTPPRYQGTPSRQSVSGSTPPRQNVDPRYSQGLVHAREQSEGSSSQASVRGAGNLNPSTRLSVGPYGSGHSSHRGVGNSLTPEQARQLLKSSNYNPDLCTEL